VPASRHVEDVDGAVPAAKTTTSFLPEGADARAAWAVTEIYDQAQAVPPSDAHRGAGRGPLGPSIFEAPNFVDLRARVWEDFFLTPCGPLVGGGSRFTESGRDFYFPAAQEIRSGTWPPAQNATGPGRPSGSADTTEICWWSASVPAWPAARGRPMTSGFFWFCR